MDVTGIRVLRRNFRKSSLFTATCKNSPSAKCVSAASLLCAKTSIALGNTLLLNKKKNLRRSVTFLYRHLFFSGFRPVILFPFCQFGVLSVFVLFCVILVVCAGLVTGCCAVKSAR